MTAFVLLLLFYIRGFKGEVYSSTAQLATVFNAQREIVGHLDRYIEDAEAKTAHLRKYADAFNRMRGSADVDEIVGNPLSAYQLIKQLAENWASVEELLDDNSWLDLIQQIQSRLNNTLMTTEDDVEGAALAILRLQQTYQLSTSDLARGNIFGSQTSSGLTTQDCLHLAKRSSNQNFFDLAIEWYDYALRTNIEETNPSSNPQAITLHLEEAINAHDLALESEENQQYTFHQPIRSLNSAEIKNLQRQTTTKHSLGLQLSDMEEDRNYEALCRGEQLRSDSEVASLHCYLSDRGDASFYINPIKVEMHSHDPQIVTFHDIIYESEIDFIKEFSKPSLKRSRIEPNVDNPDETWDGRTSQNSWMSDDEQDDQLRRKVKIIMDRVSRITGLNVHERINSEEMQVANYGIGGGYELHYDYLYRDKSPQELSDVDPFTLGSYGDRIATLMFYLSDVKLGGATVFPLIGAAVRPNKGSAVFWYNLFRNGEGDDRTMHAGCPVLLGSKWIGNKWILEVNQVFKRPCSLNPKD